MVNTPNFPTLFSVLSLMQHYPVWWLLVDCPSDQSRGTVEARLISEDMWIEEN
jgi:hypothetical protein